MLITQATGGLLITLGGSIILLLKIQPINTFGAAYPATGVDYGKGANMMLLGPFIQSFIDGGQKEFYGRLVLSLTAFQFGFLGAYVYFIGYLTRSVFTLDLSQRSQLCFLDERPAVSY